MIISKVLYNLFPFTWHNTRDRGMEPTTRVFYKPVSLENCPFKPQTIHDSASVLQDSDDQLLCPIANAGAGREECKHLCSAERHPGSSLGYIGRNLSPLSITNFFPPFLLSLTSFLSFAGGKHTIMEQRLPRNLGHLALASKE